jgi:hypothetical protein
MNVNILKSLSDVTREINVDENFHRATIAGATKPYKQTVVVPDTGRCEPFKINLKVREKEYVFIYVTIKILSTLP